MNVMTYMEVIRTYYILINLHDIGFIFNMTIGFIVHNEL